MSKSSVSQKQIVLIGIAIVIVIAGLGSWALLRSNKNNTQTSQTPGGTYTDTARVYAINYPSGWRYYVEEGGGEGHIKDWSKVSRGVEFKRAKMVFSEGVSVRGDNAGILAKMVRQNWSDNKHVAATSTINGNKVECVDIKFNGDAESYTDRDCLLTNAAKPNVAVHMTFRSKYHHANMGPGAPAVDWDDTHYTPVFENMIHSVKLL